MRGLIHDIMNLRKSNLPKTMEGLRQQDEQILREHANENHSSTINSPSYDQNQAQLENEIQQYANEKHVVNENQSEAQIRSTTTEGRLYLIALTTLDRLDIQFVPELNLSRKSDIANIQIIGRNTPQYHYIGGETELALQLDFYSMEKDRKDVINKCRWLEHLGYNDGYKTPPQKIKLVFGELFRDEVWIVKNVKYRLNNFHKQYGYLPQQAYVDIVLGLDPDSNLTWEDIRSDGGNNHLGAAKG